MPDSGQWVVVGLDNGGTTNNATVLDSAGRFLVDQLAECPSCVRDGPERAIEAMAASMSAGRWRPASASPCCTTMTRNNNDANAAALYAHYAHFGPELAPQRSSVSVIVGTGLGGGVIEQGQVIRWAAGMAGELGHVWIPMQGLLGEGQPLPECNCGLAGDAESIASLTGIEQNLLPYWLTRYPDHELSRAGPAAVAAKLVRGHGAAGDPLALAIFEQQAMAVGRLFTIAANFTDPDIYFLGGGVVEAAPQFRAWFLNRVREHTLLRKEQAGAASVALVPDRDMAGAKGSATAARAALQRA